MSGVDPRVLGRQFCGIYRGIVKENDDASEKHPYLCRVRVLVPQVYGKETKTVDLPWAWPALPFGGMTEDGYKYGLISIPAIGSQVLVIFEHGDPERPFWIGGCFHEPEGESNIPEEAKEDARTGVRYPNIILWKSPYADGKLFFRIVGDKRMEIVFDEDHYLEFDDINDKVKLYSRDWSVEVETDSADVKVITTSGDIELTSSLGKVKIQAKTLEIDATTIAINATAYKVVADRLTEVGSEGGIVIGDKILHAQ